jgi:hypothetical protein
MFAVEALEIRWLLAQSYALSAYLPISDAKQTRFRIIDHDYGSGEEICTLAASANSGQFIAKGLEKFPGLTSTETQTFQHAEGGSWYLLGDSVKTRVTYADFSNHDMSVKYVTPIEYFPARMRLGETHVWEKVKLSGSIDSAPASGSLSGSISLVSAGPLGGEWSFLDTIELHVVETVSLTATVDGEKQSRKWTHDETMHLARGIGRVRYTSPSAGVNSMFRSSDYTGEVFLDSQQIVSVTGTPGDDHILIPEGDGGKSAFINGAGRRFSSTVRRIYVDAGTGNDFVEQQVALPSTILGGEGDDLLLGGDNGDAITGGSGKDKIYGNGDRDLIDGSAGNDRLFGGDGRDQIMGGAGRDTLDGGGDGDTLSGGRHNDILFGGAGQDQLFGGSGNDMLNGQLHADSLDGGSGDDSGLETTGDVMTSIEDL